MLIIGKLTHKTTVFLLAIVSVLLIGWVDYQTGSELAFSIFYLIPVSALALYRGIKAPMVLCCAVFATALWFYSDASSRTYSSSFFPIWNALVRFGIFSTMGMTLLYLKKKNYEIKKINIPK